MGYSCGQLWLLGQQHPWGGGELMLEPRVLAELLPLELPHSGVCARAVCNAAVLVLQRCSGCVQCGAECADGTLRTCRSYSKTYNLLPFSSLRVHRTRS